MMRSRTLPALATLEHMSLGELRAAWSNAFDDPPPKLRTAELLRLALAYRMQATTERDLSGGAKRRLSDFGRRFATDRRYVPDRRSELKPGSSIVKAWRGARHEIRVLEDGFSYQGERFGSLSEVAQYITGTKWNGHVFFGLKARTR